MPRRRARIPLHVFLNARLTGTLTRQTSGAIEFRYAPGWLAWEHALPISLSLPLREERFSGGSVQAVFDNLLPDGDAMRRRIAEQVHA
ncbi:MAG: HipA N-terminal domain-containing protein, partial [Steroidobacteraceae bacterium]